MSKALYTKYRPSTFNEVIGQDVAVQILERSIEKDKINHAYLFYGVRGTGKTTLARLFAKTVNCEHPINNNPCNECESCKSFNEGKMFDLVEIDAASHNGVDEIRELTEKANFSTTESKYKVYILDEVHMLSKSAFNTLLKTLEEPPKNTIFLLATTEIEKIPDTILSRTIVLNLSLVSKELIINQLEYILKAEDKTYDKDSLEYIATLAQGSVRDAISFLETVLLYTDNVNKENVVKVLGILDIETIIDILNTTDINKLSMINEEINGKRLSILIIETLINLIKDGDISKKHLLSKIADGLLMIKDPIILNKYIKTTIISNMSIENVSHETKEVNTPPILDNVSRETNEDPIDDEQVFKEEDVSHETNTGFEEIIIEETEEITEETKELDLSVKLKEEEMPSKTGELDIISEDIFKYVDAEYIINTIMNNKQLELNELINKWVLLPEYQKHIENKSIINILNNSNPLIISDEALIIGFDDEWLYEEYKKISLECDLLALFKKLTGKELVIIPLTDERGAQLLKVVKTLEAQGKTLEVNSIDPSSIYKCEQQETTKDMALYLFGDKLTHE